MPPAFIDFLGFLALTLPQKDYLGGALRPIAAMGSVIRASSIDAVIAKSPEGATKQFRFQCVRSWIVSLRSQ